MKSSNEMVRSLLDRKAQYEEKQTRKKKIIFRTVTSLSCICLAALVGFGAWYGSKSIKTGSNNTTENTDASVPNNKIVVQQIDNISRDGSRKMNINLNSEDFVEMDKTALINYYGTNLFPDVPADLKEWQDSNGIFKRNGGTGEVYYDRIILNYSNDDFSRTVNIEIEKNVVPKSDCAFFSEIKNNSIINDTAVGIGKTNDGYYYAQFIYHNVGFIAICNGLTESEVVSIISSLIK